MGKRPAFLLYTGDWLKDPQLGQCSPATRGIWIDLLCLIHEVNDGGKISGTPKSLARICRSTEAEMMLAIQELQATKSADVDGLNITCNANVMQSNSHVTVICRRMRRDSKDRESNRIRVERHRSKVVSNENVTPPSSSSVTSSVTKNINTPILKPDLFGEFKAKYPARRPAHNWTAAGKAWSARLRQGADPADILRGAENYAAWMRSKKQEKTEFVKTAPAFLGPDRHWEQYQEPIKDKSDTAIDPSQLPGAKELTRRYEAGEYK